MCIGNRLGNMGEQFVLDELEKDERGPPMIGFMIARVAFDDDVGDVLEVGGILEVGDVLEVGEEEGVVDADESLCNAEAVNPFFQ